MKLKKLMSAAVIVALSVFTFIGCASLDKTSSKEFDSSKNILVISREEGSGTRGAFIELMGIEQKDLDGNKVDHTTSEAIEINNTSVMMTSIAGDTYGIGYISLGSLNDTVKAAKIDGVEATVENIKNGSYKVARPFNIATKSEISKATQDFINFIISTDGQKVIEENGYISVSDAVAFESSKPSGKIVVAGSSSVTPVMEKLKEAYIAINSSVKIEIQESDSTTGMTSLVEGICDIGMASRDIKDSEIEKGIIGTVIAMDGIAVIINNNSLIQNLTSEQVMKIYVGEYTKWSDVVSE